MGIQNLNTYVESKIPAACVPVDLLKISRSIAYRRAGHVKGPQYNRLCLVVDGECCLDRLYGGYFSDWVCGGQWNRMVQFLSVLMQTMQTNFIDLAVFFNGGLEPQRMDEWVKEQLQMRKNINQVLKHLNQKGTPPPKIWWIPPVCLRSCLRMALRHLNLIVVSTMDDHRQEVIGYCRENYFHGLLAEDAEYAIFDPPRYFSSEMLKLTYKGSLETREFILDEVAKGLDLNPNRFTVLAALLGNNLLTEEDLADWHADITDGEKLTAESVVGAVAGFVRALPTTDNLLEIGATVFGSTTDPRVNKLKDSVQYYVNGTKDGFLRYWPSALVGSQTKGVGMKPGDSFKFASETLESEKESYNYYNELKQLPHQPYAGDDNSHIQHTHGHMNGGPPSSDSSGAPSPHHGGGDMFAATRGVHGAVPAVAPEVMRTVSERHQKGLMSPWLYQMLTQGEIKLGVMLEDDSHREIPNIALLFRPIRQMVYSILFNQHHLQFMSNKNLKDKGVVSDIPSIQIREWVWSKVNPYTEPEMVSAVPVGWAVPTVQRLWFGTAMDDKKRRLRAFLSCMKSDTPLMLNTGYVPQHMLLLATVLRYIMSSNERSILRKQELDAFLAQAFSPQLTDAHYLQEIQLGSVSARAVQLSAMFMMGVETALFANDACGAPIPWLMCCPWLFFDGKLFHLKLEAANRAKNIMDVCNGQIDMVAKVERLSQAILEDLRVDFTPPRLPPPQGGFGRPPQQHPFIPPPTQHTRGARPLFTGGRRTALARGGQLEIGGVVVGNWGPNYSMAARGARGGLYIGGRGGQRGVYMSPHVMAVNSPSGRFGARFGPRYGPPHMARFGPGPTTAARFGYQIGKRGRGRIATRSVLQSARVRLRKDSDPWLPPGGRGMTIETSVSGPGRYSTPLQAT